MKIYLKEKDGSWKLYEDSLETELKKRNITIGEGAIIGEWASIGEWARIGEGAIIGEGASIGEGARIGEGASIGKTYDCVVICGLGSRRASLTGYLHDGKIIVGTGCFLGTADEFLRKVEEKHKGTEHERQYVLAVDYLKARLLGQQAAEKKGGE